MPMNVAALYVDPRGHYPALLGAAQCWDKARDARAYTGPDPVVAHPPCHLWVNLAAVNWKRYQRERPAWYPGGTDGGCFAAALHAVREWGGVLEHPAGSHAWAAHGLPRPQDSCRDVVTGLRWGLWRYHAPNEWVCEVWQSAYGHLARKRTWLYYVGDRAPFDLNWSRPPGTHQIGWFDRAKPTLNKRKAMATPPAFAEMLIALADWSRTPCPTN